MSKGNSGLRSKFQTNLPYTGSGFIGSDTGHEVLAEVLLKVNTQGVTERHAVLVQGKMVNATVWEDIVTIHGTEHKSVQISSYDQIRFQCLVYASTSNGVNLISSAFFIDGEFVLDRLDTLKDEIVEMKIILNTALCAILKESKKSNVHMQLITGECIDE